MKFSGIWHGDIVSIRLSQPTHKFDVDHIFPMSRGGRSVQRNFAAGRRPTQICEERYSVGADWKGSVWATRGAASGLTMVHRWTICHNLQKIARVPSTIWRIGYLKWSWAIPSRGCGMVGRTCWRLQLWGDDKASAVGRFHRRQSFNHLLMLLHFLLCIEDTTLLLVGPTTWTWLLSQSIPCNF
jgi:hypothetical protein